MKTRSLEEASLRLSAEVGALPFSPPVACVYNTIDYAWAPHGLYLRRYGKPPKRVVFLGMNPGPFGMAQTGVPFGEVAAVRDWLGIEAVVKKPANEHPKRPVTGFSCPRSEVSGRRLWAFFAKRFGTAEIFFRDHFVANYCPLVFMAEGGGNVTPDKIRREEAVPLYEACDRALAETVRILKPAWVVGVGKFAERRALAVREKYFQAGGGEPVFGVASILHPSPASPLANRGWEAAVEKSLVGLGVWKAGNEDTPEQAPWYGLPPSNQDDR